MLDENWMDGTAMVPTHEKDFEVLFFGRIVASR